jgi:redox-sensitive bicupin YhaK (pirin superfamily)
VIAGTLSHRDSIGGARTVSAGEVAVMSTGSGVRHAETNDHDEPVRYVQMWVAPTHPRIEPSYRVDRLPRTERAAAGPLPGQPDARFFVVRPDEGGSVLPDALSLHVFVATGGVDIDGVGRLAEGDAVRFTDAGPRRISGRPGSLVGVWAMQG